MDAALRNKTRRGSRFPFFCCETLATVEKFICNTTISKFSHRITTKTGFWLPIIGNKSLGLFAVGKNNKTSRNRTRIFRKMASCVNAPLRFWQEVVKGRKVTALYVN